jgi:hypothetical protein
MGGKRGYLTLSEDHSYRMFKNSVLRIFGELK